MIFLAPLANIPREATMPDKAPRNYSPYQQKVIKRYYDNLGDLSSQRLAELVGELYLSTGKKQDRLWASVESCLEKLKVPASRIKHLMQQRNPALVAELVKELEGKK
jgi:hypothetical protein